MYFVIVVGLMFVLPIVSIAVECLRPLGEGSVWLPGGDFLGLVGKWFVFWAVGVRLAIAALRQIVKPELTTRDILGISDPAAGKVARELGFANLSIGLIALLSLIWPDWVLPAAIAGGLFFGLAGAEHVRHTNRSPRENLAMVSDLAIFLVLLAFVGERLCSAALYGT